MTVILSTDPRLYDSMTMLLAPKCGSSSLSLMNATASSLLNVSHSPSDARTMNFGLKNRQTNTLNEILELFRQQKTTWWKLTYGH